MKKKINEPTIKKYNITHSDELKFIWFRTAKCGTRSILSFLKKHTTLLSEYKIKFQKEWEDHFKFTIVRNPWDRLLSTYKDKVQKQWIDTDDHPDRLSKFEKYKDGGYKFFVKNVIPSEDNHTECLTNLIDFKNIDFIGRFENLQEDFDIICDKIGIPKQQLPHANKSKHKHYTEYYDDETKQIVAEKFAKDIEYLGYEFGE
jgi:hypothetical protein